MKCSIEYSQRQRLVAEPERANLAYTRLKRALHQGISSDAEHFALAKDTRELGDASTRDAERTAASGKTHHKTFEPPDGPGGRGSSAQRLPIGLPDLAG